MSDDRSINLLPFEKSPYLLQHAQNPVHWRPWSDDAFALARELDRPVLISIGYATCHWCHVMAHESFEDKEIAAFLNDHYVCIKVDREERPDVDSLYMDVCQSMTGHGGWPLTIVADADRRPFFAGTYFPPRSSSNRIGFHELLQRIDHVWRSDRQQILHSAADVLEQLRQGAESSFRGDVPSTVFQTIADHHERTFDDTHGGFGIRPKFPSPHHLLLLFRIARRTGATDLTRMALFTLDAMRSGGLYDHVGFGFHRYSTDREWILPHFEKMLYDQATLLMAYTEAWQITHEDRYRRTCTEILEVVQRDLRGSHGAFLSAIDADSEGEEGRFYVWSWQELEALCTSDELALLRTQLHARYEGNAMDEASGNPTGMNILYLAVDSPLHTDPELQSAWEPLRRKLFDARRQRVHPLTDDKVLTDWNGLMIGALARAGRAFPDEPFTRVAAEAYAAVRSLCGGDHWVHRYRDGERAVDALLDDHAAMGWAAMELYQTTAEVGYLTDAVDHADRIQQDFAGEDGSLFSVRADVADLPVRPREGFDQAYPSGNSLAALLYVGLATILGSDTHREAAHRCVTSWGLHMQRFAPGFCMLLCAWDLLVNGVTEIVLKGAAHDPVIIAARERLATTYAPEAVVIHEPAEADPYGLRTVFPFDAAPPAAVLVCTDRTCQRPLVSEDEVRAQLLMGAVR